MHGLSLNIDALLFFLQIQRNLQLRIEEQGRYLQMMFEQQRKQATETLKGASSTSEEPLKGTKEAVQNSSSKDQLGIEAGDDETRNLLITPGEKMKSPVQYPEGNVVDGTSNSPPTKRAKAHV